MLSQEKKIEILNRQISKLQDPSFSHGTWLAETKNLIDKIFEEPETKKNQLKMAVHQPGAFINGLDIEQLKKSWMKLLEAYIYEVELENESAPARDKQKKVFIHPERIEEINGIKHKEFDFKKLVALCQELNSNFDNENYLSVAMLGRAIIDHIPPVFKFQTFNEVANNYGSSSFKKSMEHLNKSMRTIADTFLHQTIRNRESLPNEIQIDFSRELDVLLSEIVRCCR